MKRFILIDSHAIIHRAYHALPPLTSTLGEPVNAVYGFTTILLRIMRELKPDYIAAAFDLPGPTFRHIAYERYKAQRPETPSDLSGQFNKVREVVNAFGITMFEKEGYEADDIIGTIAKKMEKNKSVEVIVVTGDMDTLQLIRPGLKVYAMKKGISDTMIYGEKEVVERYGITPKQMIDFKGLKGDPSDNIPGVKGIGEKTAAQLIQEFDSIEGIYKALKKKSKKISASVATKLALGEEEARFSRDLSAIKTDIPIDVKLDTLKTTGDLQNPVIARVLQKFGFTSLVRRIMGEGASPTASKKTKKADRVQGGMFAESSFEKKKTIILIDSEKDWDNFSRLTPAEDAGLILFSESGDTKSHLFAVSQKTKEVYRMGDNVFTLPFAKKYFTEYATFSLYDAKSIIHFLRKSDVEIGGVGFDLMLAAYLTSDFSRDVSYLGIVSRELGRLVSHDPREEFSHLFEIKTALEKKLEERALDRAMYDIDLPLVRILADMEDCGVLLDREFLADFSEKLNKEIDGLIKKIHTLAGEEFNINSSQQLSKILFEKLEIKTHGLRKTEKGGVVSTGASELEKLKTTHPIIEHVLQYRELAKLKSTYVDVLPRLADLQTNRIHTTFHQTTAATGRLSSSDPNLQNIPIMSEYGREIRRAFIAEKGFVLASFDYSQIELRVAAILAKDVKMIEAFKNGVDIHVLTASEVYGVPIEKVTSELRRAAKTLNFGILYGMGPQSLSESTGMARDDAKKFITEYFRNFSGIHRYIEETKKGVLESGFVETLFGRRRSIPEINSANWQIRREAERMAVNTPVQGTAADLVKLAMIALDVWIKKEKYEDRVRLLLQVHDELVFEIKEDIQNIIPEIKRIMEGVAELDVPLVVDAKVGKNWKEMIRPAA